VLILLNILLNSILPIFLIIALGFAVGRKFDLDPSTITKVSFYTFVPAFSFTYIFTTDVTADLARVIVLAVALLGVKFAVGAVITRLLRLEKPTAKAFQNALMFFNSGNIGLSLVLLVFTNPPFTDGSATPYLETALSVQIMIFLVQNLAVYTLGIVNSGGEGITLKTGVMNVLRMPVIYAVVCAFAFKLLPFDFTATPVWTALMQLRNGLIGVVLVTLGLQLAKTNLDLRLKVSYLAVFCRLIVGPAAAFALIRLFGFSGVMAQAIFISSSAPTAVMTALISVECKGDSDFAVQAVTLSTLFSAVTMTLVVYLSYVLF
jgi:hypothetical protein